MIGSVAAGDTSNSADINDSINTNIQTNSMNTTSTDNSIYGDNNSNSAVISSNSQSTQNKSNSNNNSIENTLLNNTTSSKISKSSNTEITSKLEAAKKVSTKVTVSNVETKLGAKTTLTATIKTTSGKNITSGVVAFKINGKTQGYANISKSTAKYTFTLPTTWKNPKYTITAVYGGSSSYDKSQANGTLKIYSDSTTKTTVKILTTTRNSSTTLQATIKTTDGQNVTNGKVAFKINGKTQGYANVTKGIAKYTFTTPNTWKSSNYTITAVYGGSTLFKKSQKNGTLYVYSDSKTKISVKKVTASVNSSATLTATIKTTDGKNVTNGKLSFKVNGKTLATVNVTNGTAKYTFKVPTSWKKNNYTITAVYGGTSLFKKSQKNGTLFIIAQNVVPSGYENQAKAIFNYVNKHTAYSYYANTRNGAVNTLTKGYGNCVDTSHLMIAMMRSANIPARYVHGHNCVFRSGLVTGHVWAQVYVNGKWYNCDATSSSNTFGTIVNWKTCSSKNYYISLPF